MYIEPSFLSENTLIFNNNLLNFYGQNNQDINVILVRTLVTVKATFPLYLNITCNLVFLYL